MAQLLWWQGLASCFESIVKQLAESGDLKDMACQCLGGLGKAVHGCSLPCNIQVWTMRSVTSSD